MSDWFTLGPKIQGERTRISLYLSWELLKIFVRRGRPVRAETVVGFFFLGQLGDYTNLSPKQRRLGTILRVMGVNKNRTKGRGKKKKKRKKRRKQAQNVYETRGLHQERP